MKCTFKDCPFEGEYDNCCMYHAILINFWFYELDGVKFCPAELTRTITGELTDALYPETADLDAESYRARYQKWADELGQEGRDRIVVAGGGEPWDVFCKKKEEKTPGNIYRFQKETLGNITPKEDFREWKWMFEELGIRIITPIEYEILKDEILKETDNPCIIIIYDEEAEYIKKMMKNAR